METNKNFNENVDVAEKAMTEKESLELITRMINATKEDMNQGHWNPFIVWGLFTTLLGCTICALVWSTYNAQWQWLWFLMAGFWIVDYRYRKTHTKGNHAVTYNSKAIGTVWKVLGFLFILTPVTFTAVALTSQTMQMMNMIMPLTLIYLGIGVSFTGIILKEKLITYIPIVSMVIPFYLISCLMNNQFSIGHLLLFSLSFLIVLVLPGIILNREVQNVQVHHTKDRKNYV